MSQGFRDDLAGCDLRDFVRLRVSGGRKGRQEGGGRRRWERALQIKMASLWVPILEATDRCSSAGRWLLLFGPSRESLRTANETSPAATAVNLSTAFARQKPTTYCFGDFGTSLAHLRLTSSLKSAMPYLLPPKDPQLFVCFKNSRDLETHRRLFRGRVACNHSQSFRDALHSAKPASSLYRVDREASTILACEDSTGNMHLPLT